MKELTAVNDVHLGEHILGSGRLQASEMQVRVCVYIYHVSTLSLTFYPSATYPILSATPYTSYIITLTNDQFAI